MAGAGSPRCGHDGRDVVLSEQKQLAVEFEHSGQKAATDTGKFPWAAWLAAYSAPARACAARVEDCAIIAP